MPVSTGILRDADNRLTELNGQIIRFPRARRLDQLFSSSVIVPIPGPGEQSKYLCSFPAGRRGKDRLRVSDWCWVQQYGEDPNFVMQVTIHDHIKDWIKRTVLKMDDILSFQINVWPYPSTEALVQLKHSKILAPHYLAVIDADSIPRNMEDME